MLEHMGRIRQLVHFVAVGMQGSTSSSTHCEQNSIRNTQDFIRITLQRSWVEKQAVVVLAS